MPVTEGRLEDPRSERGTTLVELLVAMAAGIVVMAALATLILTMIHGTARVSARVDATQRARIAVTRIIEQLHSACIAPKAAPVLEKSTGTNLRFIHAVGSQGSQVAPIPTKTEIKYSSGTLTQYDYTGTGTYPATTYAATPTTTILATKVTPIPPSSSIFTYAGSSSGAVTEIVPGAEGLSSTQAIGVIEVRVALNASPLASASSPVVDADAAASIRDAAVLRLTPPSYNEKATAPPCQ
jgi:Tfp pilus assembly protein PilW